MNQGIQMTRQVAGTLHAEAVQILACDGCLLSGLHYVARAPLKGQLIMAGATGVPQLFYRHFAEHASRQGFSVWTFDYRGIGLSRTGPLQGFQASFTDWARLDLAAMVDHVDMSEGPIFMTGHSFAGHAFGMLPNHGRIAAFHTFGTGAGWHGWMPRGEAVRIRLLWDLVLPVLVAIKGYMPSSRIGLGEDLPLGVYQQWRRWCRFPNYFFDDPGMAHLKDVFARVRTPITAGAAMDDAWALPASRNAFMKGYRNADVRLIDIDPAPFGRIGHMGYFRPKAAPLWDEMLAGFAAIAPHAQAAACS